MMVFKEKVGAGFKYEAMTTKGIGVSTELTRGEIKGVATDDDAIKAAATRPGAKGLTFYPCGLDLGGVTFLGVFALEQPTFGDARTFPAG